jgi:peptidoglycan/LPS O-acetylase OafA/YrhL
MEPDALTFLSYELIVYLVAPVIILLLISLHKESRGERPLKGILWFGAAMMALCAVVILFTTLHRATVLGKTNRIETAPSRIR